MKYLLTLLFAAMIGCSGQPSKSDIVDSQYRLKKNIEEYETRLSAIETLESTDRYRGQYEKMKDSLQTALYQARHDYDSLEFELKKY